MLLTALMKLGLSNHPAMQGIIDALESHRLPDGGYVCQRIMNKLDCTPKSCYTADIHALFFIAECKKKGKEGKPSKWVIFYTLFAEQEK